MKIIHSAIAGLSPRARALVAGIYSANTSGQFIPGSVFEYAPFPVETVDEPHNLYMPQSPASRNTSIKRQYKKQLESLKEKTVAQTIEGGPDQVFELRKVTLMAEMLLRNGLRDEGTDLLRRLIVVSEELELFSERSQLYTLADSYNLHFGGIHGKTYRQEIAHDLHIYQQSVGLVAVFISGRYAAFPLQELKKYEKSIEQLNQNYEQSGLSRIGYFYHYASLCYAMAGDNFKAAIFHGELLIALVQKNPRIFSIFQTGEVTRLLAASYLARNNVKKALAKANEAVKHSVKHTAGHAHSLEMLFCVLFNSKQFSALPEIVGKIKRSNYLKRDRQSAARWRLRIAYMHFCKGYYTEALRQLKDTCCLPREDTEWVIYSQLLEAMCRIELGQHEWFPIRAEALRKCIYRYENKNKHKRNGRLVLIYRLIRQLHTNGLDYSLLVEEEHDAFELLASSEGNFFCNPSGPEILRFEEWVHMKARKQGLNRKGKRLVT
ncbi:MAG TPA: hypothetical protein VK177_19335 [Flavobacteriales bacterium]|nr:hypothetical protein [Flavobacteriales bacterium]